MKFRVIERKHKVLEPELEATPCILTDEEQKAVGGGRGCVCYGNAYTCGARNKSCSPNRTWVREESSQE